MHVALRSAALVVLVALAACEQKPTETAPTENTAAAASNADARPDTKGIKPIEGGESAPAGADLPAPADVAAPPADALKTASGLSYKVLTPGSGGDKPTAEGMVTVHYTGWTTDGKMFDSSVLRGKPAMFPLNRVIPGWTEGGQLMVVGEKTRFWIPKELAYNDQPGAPAGTLVFEIELIEIADAAGAGAPGAHGAGAPKTSPH